MSNKAEFDSSDLYFRFKLREANIKPDNDLFIEKLWSIEPDPQDSQFTSLIKANLGALMNLILNDIQQSSSRGENYTKQVIRKWISVAFELEKLNNNHSLFGVATTLLSLSRQNNTLNIRVWEKIPDQNKQWLWNTLVLFSRGDLLKKEISMIPPCIPYFPAFFGLAKKVRELKNLDGLLDIAQICKIGEILCFFKRLQQTPYPITRKLSIVTYLNQKI
eukprot:TRINITY_DN10570_c0_g1_i10.p1 TRINITY_DN10570_c0_g1~~TRINITY_DN10570_c0_g1_i10.p1  ORF type:complete len:257 (-),score=51.89 TRINITY_DN10570_c0_g1_i10:661-1317(-)